MQLLLCAATLLRRRGPGAERLGGEEFKLNGIPSPVLPITSRTQLQIRVITISFMLGCAGRKSNLCSKTKKKVGVGRGGYQNVEKGG